MKKLRQAAEHSASEICRLRTELGEEENVFDVAATENVFDAAAREMVDIETEVDDATKRQVLSVPMPLPNTIGARLQAPVQPINIFDMADNSEKPASPLASAHVSPELVPQVAVQWEGNVFDMAEQRVAT